MQNRLTALERAFELARSGECHGTDEIRKRLNSEGYSGQQVTGPTLLRQLRELCARARIDAEPESL
jgi:LmbE family N-acetylglucosaminyl deacetylase